MKTLITIIIALALSISANAQGAWPGASNKKQEDNKPAQGWNANQGKLHNDRRQAFSPEQFMNSLVDFVNKEAHLTEAEATKFEPILREMYEKQHAIMGKQRKAMFHSRKNNNLTEDDYERIVSNSIATDIELKKIEQTYYKKFHSVLSWKKVFAVRIALQKWQMEALNRFQPNRGSRRNQQRN